MARAMARTVICLSCSEHGRGRQEMRPTGETPTAWLFRCARCDSHRAVTKNHVGGTVGAGDRRDDGSRNATGKGFGDGRRRYNPVT